MYLTPYGTLSQVPTPINTPQPRPARRRAHHTQRHWCPFSMLPLDINHTSPYNARDDYLHIPAHLLSHFVILQLIHFSGPPIILFLEPTATVAGLLPQIHHVSPITAASDNLYVTNEGAPHTDARQIIRHVSEFAPILYMRQAGRLRAALAQHGCPSTLRNSSSRSQRQSR